MRTFKSIFIITMVTASALVYVHQQVELVKLSYAIDGEEKSMKEMLDLKESLEYNIKNLESPARLAAILASKRVDVVFPKKAQIVKVAYASRTNGLQSPIRTAHLHRKNGMTRLVEFFGSVAEAQAKER